MTNNSATTTSTAPGTMWEVFTVFLRLGLTSFGGPVAHLGYFHEAFVQRRKWLGERAYADLVALCQMLPGPASSQVGMALGLQRAGVRGLVAAWVGFTLPSALALFAFALGADWLARELGSGWITGLKAAAVAVVANAVLGMARTLAPDAPRATVAVGTMAVVLLFPGPVIQLVAMALAALIGLLWLRHSPAAGEPEPAPARGGSRKLALACLVVFGALLVLLPVLVALTGSAALQVADIFYRVGSLVFGGGHVVLSLLQTEVVGPGLVSEEMFLAGYGAAQAIPGPLFTFSSFLGALIPTSLPAAAGSLIALLAMFLPSALLVLGVLPFWGPLSRFGAMRRALTGVNAAVVGLLAAALYEPVFTHGVPHTPALVLAVMCFVALSQWKVPAWAVALGAALAGGVFF